MCISYQETALFSFSASFQSFSSVAIPQSVEHRFTFVHVKNMRKIAKPAVPFPKTSHANSFFHFMFYIQTETFTHTVILIFPKIKKGIQKW